MTNHIEFQDSWGESASGVLSLHDSDLERDDKIRRECAEWETHPEPSYKTNGISEPDFEPELIGLLWDYDVLLKYVQQQSAPPR